MALQRQLAPGLFINEKRGNQAQAGPDIYLNDSVNESAIVTRQGQTASATCYIVGVDFVARQRQLAPGIYINEYRGNQAQVGDGIYINDTGRRNLRGEITEGQTISAVAGATAAIGIMRQGQRIDVVTYASPITGTIAITQGETCTVSCRSDTVLVPGIDAGVDGVATIYSTAVVPEGIDSARYGLPSIRTNKVFPEGIDSLEFSSGIFATDNQRFILTHGLRGSGTGLPTIYIHGIFCTGFDNSAIGSPIVTPWYIRPTGWDDMLDPLLFFSSVGEFTEVRTNKIFPNGIQSMAFGLTTVLPKRIFPVSIVSLGVGICKVEFYIRTVYPRAFDSSEVWDDYGRIDVDTLLPAHFSGGSFDGELLPP